MKIKHISLLVLSTAGFLASCGGNNTPDQKFLDTINSVVNEHKDEISTCYDAVELVNKLRNAGAKDILVVPIERII